MANLEIGIGADNSELLKKIDQAEKEIKKLEKQEQVLIKAGLDTSGLNQKIKEAKGNLDGLRTSLNNTSKSFEGATKSTANAGNTLTNFSRIAQDAPFGIIGIGNNLTSTAEAFAALSKDAGGAGGALKALGSSLMGGGGVLLAVSLVTTALTVMSQKGITVGDVFNKLTGNFDEFKKGLQDINKEAVKSGNEQAASVGAYVSAAKDINLSMHDRLIAVKKLQDEYPGYFGNLSKEQILNGDVSGAVKEVTKALIARAKAQAFAEKIGVLASEKLGLREKETELIAQGNEAIKKRNDLLKQIEASPADEKLANRWVVAGRAVENIKDELADVQKALRGNISETSKWENEIDNAYKSSIKLDEQIAKPKKLTFKRPDIEGVEKLNVMGGLDPFKGINKKMWDQLNKDTDARIDEFSKSLEGKSISLSAGVQKFFNKGLRDPLVLAFNEDLKTIFDNAITNTFGGIGESIGSALASGGSVVEAVGASLVASMGSVLSAIGDKLIALGAASLLASTVFSSFGTALGVGDALAAIAGGMALKAGGSIFSGISKGMTSGNDGKTSVSAGNSVSSPTSSVSSGSSFNSGSQTVVFEISGQSLVGVLSNTLNKNTKLGGAPAI